MYPIAFVIFSISFSILFPSSLPSVGLFVGHHDALSTGDRLQLQRQGLWLRQMGCSSANELFLKSYDGGSLLVDQICILDEGGLGWDSVK